MSELPIFRENPFPALDDVSEELLFECRGRFDTLLDFGESASNVREARVALETAFLPTKAKLMEIHRILFGQHSGAGMLRDFEVADIFGGQDCPQPEFIERSLDNFEQWLGVDSFNEIHPIQQTALTLTRLVDIWPFAFGNRTVATVFANGFLGRAGHPPFLVLPEQSEAFDNVLSGAIRMDTAPLVRMIYHCIETELDHVRR